MVGQTSLAVWPGRGGANSIGKTPSETVGLTRRVLVCAGWCACVCSDVALLPWKAPFLLTSDQGRAEGWGRLRGLVRTPLSTVRLRLRRLGA